MQIRRPSHGQLRDIADGFGFALSDADIAEFSVLAEPMLALYEAVHLQPDELPPVKYPRTPGYQPTGDENPYNAWYVKTRIEGRPGGKLSGKTVALKDTVCLAGVPQMNGASTLEGYVPDIDATIVDRILDEGGTILGKVQCEYYCFSGSSHTSARGPVHNPRRIGYSAGGSSSGSAAVVAAGEVDMAIGGDQAGSIRWPASYCGIYGLKPTHGLVPYTGIIGVDPTIDHAGPMTATVADNALLLEVLAGPDGIDARQNGARVQPYTEALGRPVRGLKIAVVTEGFGAPGAESAVDELVRRGAARLAALGARVDEVSIPMHRLGTAVWGPIGLEGGLATMMKGNGFGTGTTGLYVTSLLDAHAAWRQRAHELTDNIKLALMVAEYFQTRYRGRYYAKAQNLRRRLCAAYDAVLADYDLLLMPTSPITAPPLPPPDADRALFIQRCNEMMNNTPSFDVTHHPALSLPCGTVDGMPVGMMLVAKHFDEMSIYTAAHAFEQAEDWRRL